MQAYGNLLSIKFEGDIRQGEVGYIRLHDLLLAAEVIEISDNLAKMQVFEDTTGIQMHTQVDFSSHLLEAELGPGLLTAIFDGLQNPLEKIAEKKGYFLARGVYLPSLDREKEWGFTPVCQVNDIVERGDILGEVEEKMFSHKIMVPFSQKNTCRIQWIAKQGSYRVEDPIAKAIDMQTGKEMTFTMLQRWPIKMPLSQGKKNQTL